MSEVPRRVEEALKQDDRVEKVENYEFERIRDKLKVTFTVVTNVGEFETELIVNQFNTNDVEPPINVPDQPSDDPEENVHRHIEEVRGDITYVYCEHVDSPYKSEDGKIFYYPYEFYF